MKPSPRSLVLILGIATLAFAARELVSPRAGAQVPPAMAATQEITTAEITTAVLPDGLVSLRVDFRSRGRAGAKEKTPWDGELGVSGGRVRQIRLWQPDPRNSVDGSRWKLSTRHQIPWNIEQRKRGHETMPLQDGSLLVELLDVGADTEVALQTAQGNFRVKLSDVPYGAGRNFVQGLVTVTRVANAATILSAPTEDDFPSAALDSRGRLHVAYVAFSHGKDFRRRVPLEKPPESFGDLAQPTGGDQVLLLTLEQGAWKAPVAVTPRGEDVYRTAIAVDGSDRVWVFWSASRDGNWDLHARWFRGAESGTELRLSQDPGPDIFPAAAADSSGIVWVAWQAFGGDHSDILASRQEDDAFGKPKRVSTSPANEWTPAIATGSGGEVAIAWDTYAMGSYDVLASVLVEGEFAEPIVIADGPRAQMRASATYDRAGRLWVAYEDAPEKWGKDWGALDKEGTALYQGRSVDVRVWSGGKLWKPAGDPVAAFVPGLRSGRGAGNQQNRARNNPRLALPRLTTDAGGRVWLAVRSPRLGTRVGVGTTWFEHVAWHRGGDWSDEIVCPSTDNVLDCRPSLVPAADGTVLLLSSSDGRFTTAWNLPAWLLRDLRKEGQKIDTRRPPSRWPDPVNNELVMASFDASGTEARPPQLEPDAGNRSTDRPPSAPEHGENETTDVARARAARVSIDGKALRLWRGEFHRHTELSQDGGGDGLLLDMWRYGLDAASLDWIGNGDHDNGGGREYSWWITQKTTDVFHVAGAFTPMFTYERSCTYPDGHRNVVFSKRGIRTLPRLKGGMGKALDELGPDAERPNTPDTLNPYRYLEALDGICASHTSGTDMGTDWRDNDTKVEPIVEIYQGCRQSYEMPGAPRSNTEESSIGGWRPFGFVSLALKKGYRLGFQSSSDHTSTHISYCNVWVEEPTREAILAAMKARHVYGSTDNIVAEFRCGEHFMGDEFSLKERPTFRVRLTGTAPFSKVHVIKDGNHVHTIEPGNAEVDFTWTDFAPTEGKTSYYYVRGEQEDGELVWVSPMWIRVEP